ncbi:secretion protein [Pseudoxanthomonas gei]|uniref:Secretion protein n=1 Tax=Pseudoxanthomonas gei TaxID=1383030 RepID=A0ABX0ADX2_9GAMM|nr:type IV secretion system protein VirB10 [Pseudoxanthomonas gei]NDK38446.1 secretion protein [Pseudoxanthomonas gei]
MSQNLPPDPPARSQAGDDPRSATYASDPHADAANPYYANQQREQAPDLDANAPQLKSSELQRLNRKALFFLCGIVLLLIIAAVWMFNSATAGNKDAVRTKEEKVVIPDLPASAGPLLPMPPPVEPIEVESYAAETRMPPLPPETAPAYASTSYEPAAQATREPTLMERRMMNSAAGGNGEGSGPGSQQDPYVQAMLATLPGTQPPAPVQAPESDASSAQYLSRPDALLVRGTYIRCVLETRIVTDIPGFSSCVVTEPIYSINGRSLLLPKGSKISGKYNNAGATGERVAVIWDRITTPNGIDVNMASPGVDNLGSSGHPGKYNAHWGSRIASALMISLISDAFSYAAAENGPRTTTIANGNVIETPFESSTARTMERLANQALDKSINRPPTVTINQGTVVNVYVARDVDFSGVLARN